MAPLNDLPEQSRVDGVTAVASSLGIALSDAETIVAASEPLWGAMEAVGGLVDSWGRSGFRGLFPRMVALVRADL